MLRKLELADMDAAALVRRTAFAQALPWLASLHTAEEDQRLFRERLFKTCQLWSVFAQAKLVGLIAFREDLDRSTLRPAKGAAARGRHGAVAGGAARIPSSGSLDVSAQCAGPSFL
jgi:hypothetical protein